MATTNSLMIDDLARLGLQPKDVLSRIVEAPERGALGIPPAVEGYVLPYYTLYGKPLPHYRARLFDYSPVFKIPKDRGACLYTPPRLRGAATGKSYLLLTVGELVAAAVTKLGFPCVALPEAYAWRARFITLPSSAELTMDAGDRVKATIPASSPDEAFDEKTLSVLIGGLESVIDLAISKDITIVMVYETDPDGEVPIKSQKHMAELAFELRYRGLKFNRVKQLKLPHSDPMMGETSSETGSGKLGTPSTIADFILSEGTDMFQDRLDKCLKSWRNFPRHPNIKEVVNTALGKASNLRRKELQALSMAILTELDYSGRRLYSPSEFRSYYFDGEQRRLIRAEFPNVNSPDFATSSLTKLLYERYGVSPADRGIALWLNTLMSSEQPIENIAPERVIARRNPNDDFVLYQLSASQYVRVSGDDVGGDGGETGIDGCPGLDIFDNGHNGIMFEEGHVGNIDSRALIRAYAKEHQRWVGAEASRAGTTPRLWCDVMSTVRLDKADVEAATNVALLFYVSPWLYRWRGAQMPVELATGEAGSGKSTLYGLRLDIITGYLALRGIPSDIRDWQASITSTGGLHVTDNAQLIDKSFRNRLSDEICRLVTEPRPFVEQRKLYSNLDLMRVPVNVVFALTALVPPFNNVDILQRSFGIKFDKGDEDVTFEAEWKDKWLARGGGRIGWLAHQLYVLHRFFRLVKTDWNPNYKAQHRLINFEQCMILMAKTLGLGNETLGLTRKLMMETRGAIRASDWVLLGISAFVESWKKMVNPPTYCVAGDIVKWCAGQEDYAENEVLNSAHRLGRYLVTNKHTVAANCDIVAIGMMNNRTKYGIRKTSGPSERVTNNFTAINGMGVNLPKTPKVEVEMRLGVVTQNKER